MLRTKPQNKRLFALLNQKRIDADTRKGLVAQFTDGRTESSAKMLVAECEALINSLAHDPAMDRMRKKIIALFRKMGYEKKGKADMFRINIWCKDYGHANKYLNAYTNDELTMLVTQAQKTYNTFINTL